MVPLLLLYTSFEFDQKVNREAMGGLGGLKIAGVFSGEQSVFSRFWVVSVFFSGFSGGPKKEKPTRSVPFLQEKILAT